MSYLLNVLLQCASEALATELTRQLARDTRPLFEEDVSPHWRQLFRAIELVEFPNELAVSGNQVWMSWFDQQHWQFQGLFKLLALEGMGLIAAYEVPDYVDEDNGQWFWLPQGEGYRQVKPVEAVSSLPKDVVEKLKS